MVSCGVGEDRVSYSAGEVESLVSEKNRWSVMQKMGRSGLVHCVLSDTPVCT